MKELTIEEKAKLYDEAIERAESIYNETAIPSATTKGICTYIFPELAESDDERIRKHIIEVLRDHFSGEDTDKCIAWLEKQGKKHLVNYDEAEKEKADFVGDGFIECHVDFLDFKEGNTYWLEYIGDDMYNVRSDNLLGKTYHITPCQLYTVFKKLTWIEKQGKKKPIVEMKSPKESLGISSKEYNEIVNNCLYGESKPADKVEPKFKVGDMISNGTSEVKIVEVNNNSYGVTNDEIENDCNPSNWVVYFKDQDNWKLFKQKPTDKVKSKFKEGDWVVYENRVGIIVIILKEHYIISFDGVEEQVSFTFNDRITKWTIQDAKDGDVLVCPKYAGDTIPNIFIFKDIKIKDNDVYCYCSFLKIFATGGYVANADPINTDFYPATKGQRKLLFAKMKEAGYEWNAEKKELKKVEQNTAWSKEDENIICFLINITEHYRIRNGFSSVLRQCDKAIDWLKALKERYTWKPSDEQMESITCAVRKMKESACYDSELISLLNDLKKLREE